MTPDLIQPEWPAPPNVHAFTTTRNGGVSEGVWSSLNLGAHCGDRPRDVLENRATVRRSLPAEPFWLNQVHGTRVVRHTGSAGDRPPADAIFSKHSRQVCAVLTADCLPVLLSDQNGTCVAAAHAGWRGLAAGVLESTIAAMDVDPSAILAWLGPAIGPQRFEVGDEVRAEFIRADPGAGSAFVRKDDRWLADLYALARQRLNRAGVLQISGGGFCTYSDDERFFSYRRNGLCGRMATLIWME